MPGLIITLRLLLAALMSAVCYYVMPNAEAYWIIISALLSLQIIDTGIWQKKLSVLFITGVCAACAAGISAGLTLNPFILGGFLFLTTFAAIYIGSAYVSLWGAAFIINFFAILSAGLSTNGAGAQARFIYILLGFGITMLLQLIFFPTRLLPSVKTKLADCLLEIAKLNQMLFTCYLSRDYAEKFYFYEKMFHEQRRDVLYALHEARAYLNQLPAQYAYIFDDIEHVYEIVLSLGSLLWRVTDVSTFEVIQAEFLSLSTNINKKIRYITANLKGKRVEDDSALELSIEELEEVNRSALQVVAKEPLVFLLFIHDLKELNTLLTQLGQAVTTETVVLQNKGVDHEIS